MRMEGLGVEDIRSDGGDGESALGGSDAANTGMMWPYSNKLEFPQINGTLLTSLLTGMTVYPYKPGWRGPMWALWKIVDATGRMAEMADRVWQVAEEWATDYSKPFNMQGHR